MNAANDDLCGLCGGTGADKIPHPVLWPGEQAPGTPYVHAECEDAEALRAMTDFRESAGERAVDEFLLRA